MLWTRCIRPRFGVANNFISRLQGKIRVAVILKLDEVAFGGLFERLARTRYKDV